ncbi:MAG: tetratricopeptide repeat protein [Anaeromyxobacter sp.]
MPRPARTLAPLLALALSGCGHAFLCEARGGPPWRELVTPRFVVHTDLPRDEARAFAAELERVDDAVRGGLARFVLPPDLGLRERPERLEVVVFAEHAQFETFSPEYVEAYLSRDDAGRERIVLPAKMDGGLRAVVAHELTHRWTLNVLPGRPMWVVEGLAVYMESLGAEDGLWTHAAASFGGMPPDRLVRPPNMWELKAFVSGAGLNAHGYATAWAIVHFLVNTRQAAFHEYLRRLARGERPPAAWRAAFPAWNLDDGAALAAFHREFDAYVRSGRYTARGVTLGEPPPIEAERPFPADRVHALRLELPRRPVRRFQRLSRALTREAEEALAERPGLLPALRILAALRPKDARALAEQAVTANPGDPAAWLFLARVTPGPADAARRDEALGRALALAPEQAEARWRLAASLLDQGRPAEALPHAERGARAAPSSPRARRVLGRALADGDRCPDAAVAYADAVQLALAEGDHALAESIRDALRPLKDRCPAAFTAAPPAREGAP